MDYWIIKIDGKGEVVWQNDLLESIENGANSQNILIDKILDKLEHIKTILC